MRFVDDDKGKRVCIHQTDLNRFRSCPEKARQIMAREILDFPGPEAMRGILAHAAIGDVVNGAKATPRESIEFAAHEEGLRYEGEGLPDPLTVDVLDGAEEAYEMWQAGGGMELLPNGLLVAEHRFEFPTGLTMADGTPVFFRGSGDVIDLEEYEVDDWKFSAAVHWQKEWWKHDRYDCQPTIYMAAAAQMTQSEIERWAFHYITIHPGTGAVWKSPPIRRSSADYQRLLLEVSAIIRLLDTNMEGPWPMQPKDWHCSPKWCVAYASGRCMGAHQPWPTWALNT